MENEIEIPEKVYEVDYETKQYIEWRFACKHPDSKTVPPRCVYYAGRARVRVVESWDIEALVCRGRASFYLFTTEIAALKELEIVHQHSLTVTLDKLRELEGAES